MAIRKASKIQEEGSVPEMCGREGRDEAMVQRRRTCQVVLFRAMGERKNLSNHAIILCFFWQMID